MKSRLVNVRLDEEHIRKARRLRENGVALSDLLRQAINDRFDSVARPVSPAEVKAAVTSILEQYPDPPDLPPRNYDVHDRRAARSAIFGKLRRRP